MNKIAVFCVLFTIAGCGGASKEAPSYAPSAEETRFGGSGGSAGADSVESEEDSPVDMEMPQAVSTGGLGGAPKSDAREKAVAPVSSEKPLSNEEQAPAHGVDSPMIVYTGFLKMRVKRLLEAVDEITKITEKMGGYIDSLAQRVIVVRIPSGDFDEVMKAFSKIGELLDRRIKAVDISEEYTDLEARILVAKEAQERLLKLLEKVRDVEERLRILQEIKRLSEQIESIESRLAELKNLLDYFTITIELVPVLEDSGAQDRYSPFSWVRNLNAIQTSIFEGKDDFALALPPGFALFEEAGGYLAQAADTTVIRGGVVDNEPMADNAFWSKAIRCEMDGRGEKPVEEGKAGPMNYGLYRIEDVQPRYYLVAVFAQGKDVYVLEVFYPTEEAFKAHYKETVEALGTFEVK